MPVFLSLVAITCPVLHQDCKCTVTNACNLANSVCDSNTDSCVCNSNSVEIDGACIDINSKYDDLLDKNDRITHIMLS